MMLRGVNITVNYPDDEVEAAVPAEMTVDQLCEAIRRLVSEETEMTSFVITAAIKRAP